MGGGASWSTVTDRQYKEVIVAKTSSLPSPKERDSKDNSEKSTSTFGAGASWSKPSDRTVTKEVASKPKIARRVNQRRKTALAQELRGLVLALERRRLNPVTWNQNHLEMERQGNYITTAIVSGSLTSMTP